MRELVIIPTGNEIQEGTVVDTNSPAMMALFLESFPACRVLRDAPVGDNALEIINAVLKQRDADLVVLIGGSGGGGKCDLNLAPDVTPSALERILHTVETCAIYGLNGHLWSRIVAGYRGNQLVINVPGPYQEAISAARAIIDALKEKVSVEELVQRTIQSVLSTYPGEGKSA